MILGMVLLFGITTQDTLSLGGAIRMGLETHPIIAAAQAGQRVALAAAREARSSRLPNVQLEASAVRFQQPMIVAPLHAFDPTQPPVFNSTLLQSRLLANYVLFDGGRRSGATAQSDAFASASRAGTMAAGMDVIIRVSTAYLELLTTQSLNEAADSRLQALTAEHLRVTQLVESGRAARVDLLRVDAARAQAAAAASDAASQLAWHRGRLERELGQPPQTLASVSLAPAPDPPTQSRGISDLITAAILTSPDLEAVRASADAADAARRIATATRLPSLRLSGGYQTFGGAAGDFSAEWQAGLSVSYPVFRPTRSPQIDRAAAAASESLETVRVARLELEQRVERTAHSILDGRVRTDALETAITHLEEVTRIEQLALSAGAGVQSEYLRAESELFEARFQLARVRHGLVLAHLSLARSTGELTPEWVDQFLEASR